MPHKHYHTEPAPQHGALSARYHYANGIYDSTELARHARWFLRSLDAIPHDFVVVTGKSGMSVAFAALAMQHFNLVTVRKGESSHGKTIEGEAPTMGRYIVLDDFVGTGATLARIERELTQWAAHEGVDAPRCVGALLYTEKSVWNEEQVARKVRRFDS